MFLLQSVVFVTAVIFEILHVMVAALREQWVWPIMCGSIFALRIPLAGGEVNAPSACAVEMRPGS
jgi:hypothetical protein